MVDHDGKAIRNNGTEPAQLERLANTSIFRKQKSNRQTEAVDPEAFFQAGYEAAMQAGCEFLFEVPPLMLELEADRAAAIRCDGENGSVLFFLVFDAKRHTMTILEEDRVSESVLEFTLSYAGVLSMLAADGKLAGASLH